MRWNLSEVLHSLGKKKDYKQVRIPSQDELGDFKPIPNDCHGNAERWVLQHPHHMVIRGFLVASDHVFIKHSVVDTESFLLDVTQRPGGSSNLLNFICLGALFDTMPNQPLLGQ
jgi:hypothetical protein